MSTEDHMDRRVQQAVELILDAEALTSGLEDDTAQVLIDWGVAEVERRARLTAHILDDDEASEVVDRAVGLVRRVMRRVARTADREGLTSREALTRLLAQTLSEVEAAEAATAVPAPEPEEVVAPAVEEPSPLEPEDVGFLGRLRRFFGGDQP